MERTQVAWQHHWREWPSRASFSETTSRTPSQRTWTAAGQRHAAGPSSVRRDTSLKESGLRLTLVRTLARGVLQTFGYLTGSGPRHTWAQRTSRAVTPQASRSSRAPVRCRTTIASTSLSTALSCFRPRRSPVRINGAAIPARRRGCASSQSKTAAPCRSPRTSWCAADGRPDRTST
jgi:hypothetical protein